MVDDNAAIARAIIDGNSYLVLGTADAGGSAWASPVWFATDDGRDFYWVSSPQARHSRNLAVRPRLGIVIFDSTVPAGDGQAVYMSATAAELTGDDIDTGIDVFARGAVAAGLATWTRADVVPPARHRASESCGGRRAPVRQEHVAGCIAQVRAVGADGKVVVQGGSWRESVGAGPVRPPSADEDPRPLRVLRIHKDESGVIQWVDEATAGSLGWRPQDMVGHRSLEFIHPHDHDAALVGWVRLLATPGGRSRMRLRHCDSAERWIWFDVANHNLLGDPDCRAVVTEMVAVLDGTPEEETTWVSSQLLHRLTESLPLGVLQIDKDRRIIFSNERLATVVGRATARTVDAEFEGVVAADGEALEWALRAVLNGVDGDIEVSLTHPELGPRRCSILLRALTDASGTEIIGALLCVIDVTEEARRRAEVEHRATYDALTQCLNRASILAVLGDKVADCATSRDRSGVAAIFADLDHFKPINDDYGHAAGDRLLQTIADRIRGAARDSDFVGRIGGDEFLIVCPAVRAEDALVVAGRIAAAVRQPADIGETVLVPSCSIGVAWSHTADDDVEALMARADAAMYESKQDRRGQPVLAG
jgi:diguanylate cyclase (GGDEF)-like protein